MIFDVGFHCVDALFVSCVEYIIDMMSETLAVCALVQPTFKHAGCVNICSYEGSDGKFY